jgi:hypothetical protein
LTFFYRRIKNIRYQPNLKGRKIAIVILGNPQRPAVHRHIDRVIAAVNAATPGSYVEVEIPFDWAVRWPISSQSQRVNFRDAAKPASSTSAT